MDLWTTAIGNFIKQIEPLNQLYGAADLLSRMLVSKVQVRDRKDQLAIGLTPAPWLPRFTDERLVKLWIEGGSGCPTMMDTSTNYNILQWRAPNGWHWCHILTEDDEQAADEADLLCKALYQFDQGRGMVLIRIWIEYNNVTMIVEQHRTQEAVESVVYQPLRNQNETDAFDYRGDVLLRERIEQPPLPCFFDAFANVVTTCANEQQPDEPNAVVN